ncbi:hypothetical protein [Streptomyces sp. NPDC058086]|uniref:hypothetical protein n=1 Tax=Streptomyces sp. NPDC058086 TaxID=3346334 RepID=UPI0036F0D615
MDFDYVTKYQKEQVENTADIERGADILVKGGKYKNHVVFIGKELLVVRKDRARSLACGRAGGHVGVLRAWKADAPGARAGGARISPSGVVTLLSA